MLIYSATSSLDGYVADRDGKWDWSIPDAEVHAAINDVERTIDTYLYGRRMYEVLSAWETIDDPEPVIRDYAAIWRSSDKVVYSRTLETVTTARTRLERNFDPHAVRAMAGTVSVGGAELAGQALAAGLVDEIHLWVAPAIVGGGKRALPDDVRLDLRLVDERRFANGTVHLHYAR